MSLEHDLFASMPLEPEDAHKRFHHVLHGVHVVIMKKDFKARDERGVLFIGRFWRGGRECRHRSNYRTGEIRDAMAV